MATPVLNIVSIPHLTIVLMRPSLTAVFKSGKLEALQTN